MSASTVSIRFTPAGVELTIGDSRPSAQVLNIFPAPAKRLQRFQKLDAQLQPVGGDATSWAFTHDTTTGLIWTADNVTKKGVKWESAEKACRELGDGWRLPTRAELLTLVDDTRHNPCTDTDYFRDVKSDWYWTSTPAAWSADCAWVVYFSLGYAYYYHRNDLGFVRAVRAAVPAGQ